MNYFSIVEVTNRILDFIDFVDELLEFLFHYTMFNFIVEFFFSFNQSNFVGRNMDFKLNPYSPGAGVVPPELVGRDELLNNIEIAFERLLIGRPERSIMIHGLRGVGKTVLLKEFEERAKKFNAVTEYTEVESSDYIQSRNEISRVISLLDKKLNNVPGVMEKVINLPKKLIQSFIDKYKFSVDIPIDIRINAENKELKFAKGLTDSLLYLGERAREQNRLILILIDEIQDLNTDVNKVLISAIHRANQKNLPVMIIGAGLPKLIENLANSKAYVERLFKFYDIGTQNASDYTSVPLPKRNPEANL